MDPSQDPSKADWLQPPELEQGLGAYLLAIRERLWIVVGAVILTTLFAVLYVATADKVYESEAGLLVSPIQSDSETLARFGLTPSIDPVRDIQTQARLITTTEVAARAQDLLEGVPEAQSDTDELLSKVSAEPIAESDIVGVTAFAARPGDAAAIANAFVDATIELRTERLHERIDQELDVLAGRLEGSPAEAGLAQEISSLEALRGGPDPTVQVAEEATPPDVPVSPRPVLSVAGGLMAGLVIGIGGAFAVRALDPRLRREGQLLRTWRLPILTRIPRESRSARGQPISPANLSPVTAEAYRVLRAMVSLSRGPTGDGGRVIFVTGTSPSEGKTTTAVNLAYALAAAGNRVILIEADLRRPTIGKALGIKQDRPGLVSVLLGRARLEEGLARIPSMGISLRLLLADYEGEWAGELFTTEAARTLVEDVRDLADYVIVDSPPLVDVVDTLPLAKQADDVLVVVRLGTSRLNKMSRLGELLAENDIRPVGVVLVGVARPARREYHYYAARGSGRKQVPAGASATAKPESSS